MEKQFVTTSASPSISLDVSGDLRLKGQDSFEVVAKSDSPDDLTLEAQDDQVTIRCTGNCTVRVPRAASVRLLAAHGDAVIKGLDGELSIDTVSGDLTLRSVGAVELGQVYGSLDAKSIAGDFRAASISGDVSVRSVEGDFTISGSVLGNLNLTDAGGNASASANGNIQLRLDPSPGRKYEFTSLGNLFCRLAAETSAEISVPRAAQVMVDLPGLHASAPVRTPYALTLGEGDAQISLTATGNVVLDTHAPDWDMDNFDFDVGSEVEGMADAVSQQITQQVDSQVRMIEDQLNAQLSGLSMRLSAAKLSGDQARRIEERARLASQRAAERAQERIRHAQERMERKFASAQRKMEMKSQVHASAGHHRHQPWNFTIPTPPGSAQAGGEPVSEDERLIILRMLQEKKITMEEADNLLSALEDKS